MSEALMLLKQLEYCLNSGFPKPAAILVSELIYHKAKPTSTFYMEYNCSSHQYIFNSDLVTPNGSNFQLFTPCLHAVCFDCLENYIQNIFQKVGLSFKYICPGCCANFSVQQTQLDFSANYFTRFIGLDMQTQWMTDNDLRTRTIKQNMFEKPKSRCYFFKKKIHGMNCPGISEVIPFPGCRHRICRDCIEKSLEINEIGPNFKCFVPECTQNLSHEFIRDILPTEKSIYRRIAPHLILSDTKIFFCPNCNTNICVKTDLFEYQCACGHSLCPRCGKFSHGDIPCAFADLNNFTYNAIECKANDPVPEYRSLYFKATANFLWDLHPAKKAELMAKHNIKFNILKVFRIINPVLQQKYDQAKRAILAQLNQANGVQGNDKNGNQMADTTEKYVFHATEPHLYTEICQNGFKIGGLDVKIKVGKVYGYGVYTATDPTMSITFYNNKSIIMCKGITGNISQTPIHDKQQFLNNKEFHSYLADFKGTQSNYYVFFKTDYVLPYYLITYE